MLLVILNVITFDVNYFVILGIHDHKHIFIFGSKPLMMTYNLGQFFIEEQTCLKMAFSTTILVISGKTFSFYLYGKFRLVYFSIKNWPFDPSGSKMLMLRPIPRDMDGRMVTTTHPHPHIGYSTYQVYHVGYVGLRTNDAH